MDPLCQSLLAFAIIAGAYMLLMRLKPRLLNDILDLIDQLYRRHS